MVSEFDPFWLKPRKATNLVRIIEAEGFAAGDVLPAVALLDGALFPWRVRHPLGRWLLLDGAQCEVVQ